MIADKIRRNKENIGYGLSIAALFVLLRWLEFRFLIVHHQLEIYIGCIALIFTILGIWLSQRLATPKTETVIIEKMSLGPFELNAEELSRRKISRRELEVLQLMANGMSNKEIADQLFVSLNTIKSHSSNIFEKLEAKRRTQAIENAKKLRLLK